MKYKQYSGIRRPGSLRMLFCRDTLQVTGCYLMLRFAKVAEIKWNISILLRFMQLNKTSKTSLSQSEK